MNTHQMITCIRLCLLGLILFASPVTAQVFDSGPSDPALFDSVVTIPRAPDIGSRESIGGDGLTTQLNVRDGGTVGILLDVNSGSEVNISGGMVGGGLDVRSGSEVNISGGSVGSGVCANSGSVVSISGGNVGLAFNAKPGSDVELVGGEFQLNGTPFSGSTISLSFGDIFTGTLTDGSAFVFYSFDSIPESFRTGDLLSNVTLTSGVLPALDLSPVVVSTANPIRPSGLRPGQTLTLVDGGSLGRNFEVVDATLNIEGGFLSTGAVLANSTVNISGGLVNTNFEAYFGSEINISFGSIGQGLVVSGSVLNVSSFANVGSDAFARSGSEVNISGGTVERRFGADSGTVVNISGGLVGQDFDAFSGSEVNISGGTVSEGFNARSGSVVNISGGEAGSGFEAFADSEVNITGGAVGSDFEAFSGSDVNISGGTVGSNFVASSGSDVQVVGGEFQLNGAPFSGPTISLSTNDVFTGTLTDGSTFIFAPVEGSLSSVALTSGVLPTLDLSPVVVSTDDRNRPSGLRAGQTLTLVDDGALGRNFEVVDATLNVEGGFLRSGAGATNSTVNISGGRVGSFFDAYSGSVVNISDGVVLENFDAYSGSVVNISGGEVGSSFDAESGSEVNISGGVIGDRFAAKSGSSINLFGSDFVLNGVPLDDSLTIDSEFMISDRDVTLSGLFADGSSFSFDLNSEPPGVDFNYGFPSPQLDDFFDPASTLTVTLVSPVLLGDCNLDGEVNFSDISAFVSILLAGTFLEQADCNVDGEVDFSDIPPFIAILVEV